MKNRRKNLKERKMKAGRLKKQVVFNLIVIALLVILLNLSILTYPTQGMKTRNTTLSFAWLGVASYAIVDDNPDFTSPLMVGRNNAVELEPGKYYWCVPSFRSCLKKSSFDIESEVSLVGKMLEAGEENATYLVENTGNVASSIEVRNLLGRLIAGITGWFMLEPGSSNIVEMNETARIIATQK